MDSLKAYLETVGLAVHDFAVPDVVGPPHWRRIVDINLQQAQQRQNMSVIATHCLLKIEN